MEDHDDVEQELTCICITALLKDGRLSIVNLGVENQCKRWITWWYVCVMHAKVGLYSMKHCYMQNYTENVLSDTQECSVLGLHAYRYWAIQVIYIAMLLYYKVNIIS